jgi:putative ABC transport system permease protein
MLGHLSIAYFRSLRSHRLTAALNFFGLAIGIAVFLTLMLFVRFETSFESWLPQSERLYAVRQTWTLPGVPPRESFSTSGALLEAIQSDFSGTEGVRVMDRLGTVRAGDEAIEEPLKLVDGNFLQIFPYELREGSAARALARPDGLVLSERLALKYFGTVQALGRTIRIAIDGDQRVYQVTGVLAPMPRQTEIGSELLLRLSPERQDPATFHNWGAAMLQTFLRFDRPGDAEALERRLPAMVRHRAMPDLGPHVGEELRLRLVPLRAMHLIEPEDKAMVATIGLVGLLTLLVACINYITLATARAGLRAREIAIRKVVGATRASLLGQFLAEAVATVMIAGALGLALVELTLPSINRIVETNLQLSYLGPDGILLQIVLALLLIGLAAGAYPSILLSRYAPAAVLASAREPSGGRIGTWIREVLVVIQFTIAVAFMIATAIVFTQTRFMRNADVGFNRSGLLLIPSTRNPQLSEPQRASFLDRATAVPGVVSITASDTAPGDEDFINSAGVGRPGMGSEHPSLNVTVTGLGFFSTYGARIVAGRVFNQNFGTDDLYAAPNIPAGEATPQAAPQSGAQAGPAPGAAARREINNAILNRAALESLGFSAPERALGQRLELDTPTGRQLLSVIGVVNNIRFHSPRGAVPGTVYLFKSREISNPVAAIRFSEHAPGAVEAQLHQLWHSLAPDVPFQAITAEDNLAEYYAADVQRSRVFTAATFVAVLISCLGLYGLASFSTARRTKEIGIRKALGATSRDILMLMTGQTLRPVLLANLLAWPLAYVAMRSWLNGFDQRVDLDPLVFIGAACLALIVAAGTVSMQVLKVSRAPPAQALRYE